jgi:hypothetical protein
MPQRLLASVALFLVLGGPAARAELCTIDVVPAAILLLPYFEVDLNQPDGVTTLFSISNAADSATLANVVLWTDHALPTAVFNVYLTGYDIQTFNLRDLFVSGAVAQTADQPHDPNDAISPGGSEGNEGSFSDCDTLLPPAAIDPAALGRAHTGEPSATTGRCSAARYGDGIARGYITIDTLRNCTSEYPGAPGYFPAIPSDEPAVASNVNQLMGDYFYLDAKRNFAQSESMVHIEACNTPSVGQGSDECPYVAGDYTFYSRYVGGLATDGREPLPTQFFTRFLDGGLFTGGTRLAVWRDTRVMDFAEHECGSAPSWRPLRVSDVVAVDEQEQSFDLCSGADDTCFPLATQRVSLSASPVPGGASPNPPFPFGGLFLNLNSPEAEGVHGRTAQAWVSVLLDADDRFGVGHDAVQLDSACDTNGGGGTIWIP